MIVKLLIILKWDGTITPVNARIVFVKRTDSYYTSIS